MLKTKVVYRNQVDRPLLYSASKTLNTIEYNRGWIEYLQNEFDVYYVKGIPFEIYKHWKILSLSTLKMEYFKRHSRVLGLYNHLNHIRYDSDFTLPLFANFSNSYTTEIACGSSRFLANISCGIPAEEISLVFQVKHGCSPLSEIPNSVLLNSTAHAEHLLGINDTEYEIVFRSHNGPISVESSIISGSVFNLSLPNNVDTLIDQGTRIFDFWNRFTKNQKINITITCNPEHQHLLKWDSNLFNVTIEHHNDCGFCFGAIMHQFRNNVDDKLHLWVQNITEPLHLELLLPWADPDICWYHTQNKKVHLFETTRGPESMLRTIKMIGNFVK